MARDLAVIVPTFNRRAALRECLNSLSIQDLTGLGSVFVVNDGRDSLDGMEIHPEIASRLVMLTTSGQGPARARNAALRLVTEPLVAFLDDDAIAAPDWVSRCLDLFARFKVVTAQLGRIEWSRCNQFGDRIRMAVPRQRQMIYEYRHQLYSNSTFMNRLARQLEIELPPGLPGIAIHLSGANAAVRRSFLDYHGLLDEQYFTFHDRELAWRILSGGGLVAYNPHLIVRHDHETSFLRQLRRCVKAVPYEIKLQRQYPALACRQLGAGHSSFSLPLAPGWSAEGLVETIFKMANRGTRAWLTLIETVGLWHPPGT
jgi:GT2 family glycosyltransferase